MDTDEEKPESDFDIYFQKARNKKLTHISAYKQVILNLVDSDYSVGEIKPDRFEIVNSFEKDVFIVVLHFSQLRQVRFYK